MYTLTDFFNLYKTDKGTVGHGSEIHNYGEVYANYLDQFRGKSPLFCEIGVLDGNSLRAWRDYFENGTIVGVDVNIRRTALDKGYDLISGDQDKPASIQANLRNYQLFDVILDDGSHEAKHQQECFDMLFDNLKPGGYYIIEDLHCPNHPFKPPHRWNTFQWEGRTDSTLDLVINNLDRSYYIKPDRLKDIRDNIRISEVTPKIVIMQKLK